MSRFCLLWTMHLRTCFLGKASFEARDSWLLGSLGTMDTAGALPARMKNFEQTENSSAVGSSTPAESDGGRGSAVNRLA